MAINKISTTSLEILKKKSILTKPANLTARGVTENQVKAAFTAPLFDSQNSFYSEINRIVDELNDYIDTNVGDLTDVTTLTGETKVVDAIENILNLLGYSSDAIQDAITAFTSCTTLADALDYIKTYIEATQSDLDTHEARTDNPHSVTKAQVGLGNADNTSDLNKPLSTATIAALATKVTTTDLTTDGTVVALKAKCDNDGNQIDSTYAKKGGSAYSGTHNFTGATITIPLATYDTHPVRLSQLNAEIAKIEDGTTVTYKTKKDQNGNIIDLTYAASIAIDVDSTNYKYTFKLKDSHGTVISSQLIDLPIESAVVSGSYDSTNQKIVLTLQSGSTIDVPVGALIGGLQTEITNNNKLASDLVDDTNNTHKFVTASEKAQITTNAEEIASLEERMDDYSYASLSYDSEDESITVTGLSLSYDSTTEELILIR